MLMKVEIWSDVVCPWCYIGKRRFEEAVSRFEHRDQLEVVWRSFELDPSAAARHGGPYAERLAAKYRMSVADAHASIDHMVAVGKDNGVAFNFDIAQPGNTFNAHRLLHYALDEGKQDAMKERLFAAAFTEGRRVGDVEVLVELAADVGLAADAVRSVLDRNAHSVSVREDEQRAAMLGIRAVPFFVVAEKYGVPGAQPSDVLLRVLDDVWAEVEAPTRADEGAVGCGDGSCAVAT
jgi:predicted DsbA family dithiol-disulfide isomerase